MKNGVQFIPPRWSFFWLQQAGGGREKKVYFESKVIDLLDWVIVITQNDDYMVQKPYK